MSAIKEAGKITKTKSNIKVITKAKIVLANPSKEKVPALENSDFEELQKLLIVAIKESEQIGRVYATATNINIGLESTLRSINNCKAGCVLLSANIKPKFVLGLIARNVEVKDEQVPVYVQADLEDVTCKIFNIRALALTLPKNSKSLSNELQSWIAAHLKPKQVQKLSTLPAKPAITKKKRNLLVESPKSLPIEDKTEVKTELLVTKPWGSDYISFSNDKPMDVDEDTSSDDQEKLEDALKQLISKVKKPAQIMDSETIKRLPAVEMQEKCSPSNSHTDDDDFLGSYAPLILHKIATNPNRKPRKKRPKTKKLADQKS